MNAVRDYQRARVYGAENSLRWLYDHPERAVVIDDVVLQLEPEARFGSIESVQAYVDRVTVMPSVIARFGRIDQVLVRERKSGSLAHYEHDKGIIAINTQQTRWALRELVILHELAHHYAGATTKHGPLFTATLVDLLSLVMGPQVALALAILQRIEGAN